MREVTVVLEGMNPHVIRAREGWSLRVDEDSMFYLRVIAFRTGTFLWMRGVVEKETVASFALSKLVLWTRSD